MLFFYTTSRAIQRLYTPSLEKHHLTYPQYLILVSLYDLGKISVKRIGEELDLASNTLTPLLKRMEQHGLVKRERSQEDERGLWHHYRFEKKVGECYVPHKF